MSKLNQSIALSIILIYIVACVIWEFSTVFPWDDDCIGRYQNMLKAIDDPSVLLGVWTRPLFSFIYFIPYQFSKHTILITPLLCACSSYLIYLSLKKEGLNYAYMVIPFFLFQTLFFNTSKNALLEPLAAAIIAFCYFAYTHKKWLLFSVLGGLLPLARLELSITLILWVYILIFNKKYVYVPLLALGVVIWDLAGMIILQTTDVFWLLDAISSKDTGQNRYGLTSFWHYFNREIYFTGPIVFYFFLLGVLRKLSLKQLDVFVLLQVFVMFGIYVVFSWKLSLGNAAGFIRHLASLSPLVAILACYGFGYWMESVYKVSKLIKPKTKQLDLKGKSRKEKLVLQKAFKHTHKQETQAYLTQKANANKNIVFVVAYSAILLILTYLFWSRELVMHHNLTDTKDYKHLIIIVAITLLYLLLIIIKTKSKFLSYIIVFVVSLSTVSYTLITEPPDAHASKERELMQEVTSVLSDSDFSDKNIFSNHAWIHWQLNAPDKRKFFKPLTPESIKSIPDSSIVVWENHYNEVFNRGVKRNVIEQNPQLKKLFTLKAPKGNFMVMVFQKINIEDKKQTVDWYDKHLKKHPSFSPLYVSKANLLALHGEWDRAIGLYNKAIALNTKDYEASFQRANTFFQKGDYTSAIKNYKALETKNSYKLNAYFNIALGYMRLKEYENAIIYYNAYLKYHQKNASVYAYRGAAHLLKGNKKQGCKDIEQAEVLYGGKVEDAFVGQLFDKFCKNR